MKKRRTVEEGRDLVTQFNESGLTQQAFSEQMGITKCSLNYWRKRFSGKDGPQLASAQDRFVEISVPSGGTGALKIMVGGLELSFATFVITNGV